MKVHGVVGSSVISTLIRLSPVIAGATLLLTPLLTTHEPPSRISSLEPNSVTM